jgi:murein DD-endopeptidase MepM/ murein hydrolase activator NlpD
MISALVLVVASLVAPFAPECYPPPVAVPIAVPFQEPACTWCPGHRGVLFEVAEGTAVLAVAPGAVSFAGRVAGVRYVVVLQADGLRATYGLLQDVLVRNGQTVAVGEVLGRSGAQLHFGLRDGARYLDPGPLLGRWVARPRLVPIDRRHPRAAPAARLACATGQVAR